jgi:hypothetical protein
LRHGLDAVPNLKDFLQTYPPAFRAQVQRGRAEIVTCFLLHGIVALIEGAYFVPLGVREAGDLCLRIRLFRLISHWSLVIVSSRPSQDHHDVSRYGRVAVGSWMAGLAGGLRFDPPAAATPRTHPSLSRSCS